MVAELVEMVKAAVAMADVFDDGCYC